MEFHICILSTMTPELTAANLRSFDIDFQLVPGSIQKIRWPRAFDISITLWVCHQHPVSDELIGSLLPYMDVATVWYHDHSSMSCLKVRSAVALLERSISNIWLMATRMPLVRLVHQSRVEKCYDNNGFLRPCCKDYTLEKGIEEILRSELKVQKSLYRF
jgi:hypothetical protein